MDKETLFSLWAKRDPNWDKRYEKTLMESFTDYGKQYSQFADPRGKVYGPGYELFIIAFFVGIYCNQTKPLPEDKSKVKHFGWAISNWGGNQSTKLGRTPYSDLQKYMFVALIARTDIDFIALDKGEITARSVVDKLERKMEEFANFGFDYLQERMDNQPDFFYKDSSFLQLFLNITKGQSKEDSDEDDIPEDF